MIRVDGTPRDYAWGSLTDIAEFQLRQPSGKPEAELWLGSHPGAATDIEDPTSAGGATTIANYLEQSGQPPLPYLLKLLAADHPLSIQAHPTIQQARHGFARENAAGIPLDSPQRNYKDASDKPELIVALSDTFEALCGLRSVDQIIEHFHKLANASNTQGHPSDALNTFIEELTARGSDGLAWALTWALSDPTARQLVAEISDASQIVGDDLIAELTEDYPGDPGIIVALLLNRVTLRTGEALFLPAGNLHSYIRGFGVELMAPSDNVLRGGLTAKHIDVPELLSVVSPTPVPIPYLIPSNPSPGIDLYHAEEASLRLARIDATAGSVSFDVDRPAIAVCSSGTVMLGGEHDSLELSQGKSALITSEEKRLTISGQGQIFLAF